MKRGHPCTARHDGALGGDEECDEGGRMGGNQLFDVL